MSTLSRIVAEARAKRGWTRSELARALGGDCEALERTIAAINEASAARFREWLSEEVPIVVHYRLMPSVWFSEEFAPAEHEKAYAFAAWIARERWLYVTLAASRRLTIWFEAGTGKESQRAEWVDGAGWKRTSLIGKTWRDASAFRDGIFPGAIRCTRCDGSPIERISREDACR